MLGLWAVEEQIPSAVSQSILLPDHMHRKAPCDSISVNCTRRHKQSMSGFLDRRAQVLNLRTTDNRSISGHGSCWGTPASENPAFVPPLCLMRGGGCAATALVV